MASSACLERVGHDHALAGGQPVGLDHRRPVLARACASAASASRNVALAAVGDAGPRHLPLWQSALLDSRRAAARLGPKAGTRGGGQRVGHAGGQRRLGTDDDQVVALAGGVAGDRDRVSGVQVGPSRRPPPSRRCPARCARGARRRRGPAATPARARAPRSRGPGCPLRRRGTPRAPVSSASGSSTAASSSIRSWYVPRSPAASAACASAYRRCASATRPSMSPGSSPASHRGSGDSRRRCGPGSSGGGGSASPSSCAAPPRRSRRRRPVLVDHDHAHELGERRALCLQEDRLDVQQPVLADRQHQQVAADRPTSRPSTRGVNCALIASSWLMRASIWAGPWVVVSVGNWKAIRSPYTPGSMRAATQAIMFGRAPAPSAGSGRTRPRPRRGAHDHVVRLHRLPRRPRSRPRGSPIGRPGCRTSMPPPSVAGRW